MRRNNKSVKTDASKKPDFRGTGERILIIAIACLFFIGIIGHLLPAAREITAALTPVVLLLGGAAAFLPVIIERKTPFLSWVLVVFILTFTLEVIGSATGAIFGEYRYGTILGPRLLGVPPIIGLNRTIIVFGFLSMGRRVFRNEGAAVVFSAAAAVLLDFLLEPVAIEYSYWIRQEGTVPLRNYAAWFIISLFCAFLGRIMHAEGKSRLPAVYVSIQLVYFAVMRIYLLI